MAKAFSLASWNVEHIKDDPAPIARESDTETKELDDPAPPVDPPESS